MSGNFLLLKNPPEASQKEILEKHFANNFERITLDSHISLAWEEHPSDLTAYIEDGYELNHNLVLTLLPNDFVAPEKTNATITVVKFTEPIHWEKWIGNEIDERPPSITKSAFRPYIEKRAKSFQALDKQGKGGFYGAFIGDQLIGSAGLFIFERIGRFQEVRTIKGFRRKKICSTLLNFIFSINKSKMDTSVIVADLNYIALPFYKSLGFKETQSQYTLIKNKG